jgi:peptide deformylase
MKLLRYDDQALKRKAENFDFKNPPFDPIEFSQELVKFMYDNNAICLTAPQVGVPYRLFAMRGAPQNFVCFNPRVVMPSEEEIRLDEVSLTYPGLCVKIKRSQHCKVRFAMPNGEIRTETYTGMTARTFQHCMDFLDGEVFYHKANPIHREQSLRKWKRK